MKRKRRRRGVLTVEAALIFPIFIMVMAFVLNMLNLFYFHLVMQQAVSNVGRTLGQYGYVIEKTIGLDKLALSEKTKQAESELSGSIDGVLTNAHNMVTLLNGELSLDTIKKIINEGGKFKDSLEELKNSLGNVKDNPDVIVNYLLVSAMNGADDVFIKWMIGDYLQEAGALTKNIEDIEYAVYFTEDTKDILFVVQYDYKLPFEFFGDVHLQQVLRIHPWVGGTTPGAYD